MKKLDAHQHFWRYHPSNHSWITDEMAVLKRNFMPGDLFRELIAHSIEGSVAVQADQSEEETLFLLDLSEKFEFISGVVGWIDLRSDNISERLEYFAQFPKLKGFRHVVQDEPDDRFLLGDAFMRGIELLSNYNYTYDILIYPRQLDPALQLVRNFPEQKFVVDHIAKPCIREGAYEAWAGSIAEIGQCHNVWCKVSGLVTEADWYNWTQDTFKRYLDHVFNSFGTERIMFGSDWPVCLLAASYAQVKGIFGSYVDGFSLNEQENVWSRNAKKFYGI